MNRSAIFWLLAFVITAASAIYQRMTGPTYPARGSVTIAGKQISYKLEAAHPGETPETVKVVTGDPSISGVLIWKHHNSSEAWIPVMMTYHDGELTADLPGQPPAGKLDYRVTLQSGEETVLVPPKNPVVIRFRGEVPAAILVIHIFLMFGGMLLSTRTGLEFFSPEPKLKGLIVLTIIFLSIGGFLLGPIVQKYAFGAFWTGWPFGNDLTDNKTAAAVIAWLVAAWMLRRSQRPARAALVASIITFIVYLVPHSVLGSELRYDETKSPQPISCRHTAGSEVRS